MTVLRVVILLMFANGAFAGIGAKDEEHWREIDGYRSNYVADMPSMFGQEENTEFFFSFAYAISDKKTVNSQFDNFVFLSYTGKFDFFWTLENQETRDSGPVLNRLNNPEIHYRIGWTPISSSSYIDSEYIEAGFGHESNGQRIDNVNEFNRALEQGEYAIDYVSRGWDYVFFEWRESLLKERPRNEKNIFLSLNVRRYLRGGVVGAKEDEIFWEQNVERRIDQFDGLRIGFEYEHRGWIDEQKSRSDNFFNGIDLSVMVRSGIESPFRNNSITTELTLQLNAFIFYLPLMLKYFDGYSDEIVRYEQHSSYRAIGIKFAF